MQDVERTEVFNGFTIASGRLTMDGGERILPKPMVVW
jgi:hypothetical protein